MHLINPKSLSLLLMLFCWSAGTLAKEDISGVWQHADKAASIEFDLQKGEARIASHADNPEATGLNIIKQIMQISDENGQWKGKMYDGYQNRYVVVLIELVDKTRLQVKGPEGKVVLTLLR